MSRPETFRAQLAALLRARLAGQLDFEQFARANLLLHEIHGRPGYTRERFDREVKEYRARTAKGRC